MREVVVIGAGMHRFGRFPNLPFTELGRVAIVNAIKDAGIQWNDVQACYAGSALQGMGAGHRVCAQVGKTGIPIYNIENACGSGSGAAQLACNAVAGGQYDIVCAVGFEKQSRGTIPAENYPMWARLTGLGNYPAWEAQAAQRHMYEYGTTREQLAQVAVNSHFHASLCPDAAYNQQGDMTVADVLNSRMIAYPITMYMVGPANDGGAAVIICAKEVAHNYSDSKPIMIASTVLVTSLYSNKESTFPVGGYEETKLAAKRAYETAGLGPQDIDVVNCADQFAINEILSAEALWFCKEGEGGPFVQSGKTRLGGEIPFNTDGSYISRGNAVGATGLAGIVEIVRQLKGQAGPRQVEGAKIGLAHSLGAGVNIFVNIFKS